MRTVNRMGRTRIVVYILAGYVLLQFTWWAFSLERYARVIRDLKADSGELASQSVEQYRLQVWMIFGEGAVFLLLLLLGIGFVLRYLKREEAFQTRQSEFLAMFTHELKSPIASIRLTLQTLSRDRAKPEVRASLFANAEEETRRLEGLTDKILQSSRLSLDPKLWAKEPVDLSKVCAEVSERMALRADGQNLTSSIAPDIFVKGDRMALISVVTNLLENALLHTPEGTACRLQLSVRDANRCVLEVADQGLGIPDADKARIFQRFVRRTPNGTQPQKGSGLGLYLVRGLVALHGGQVEVLDNTPTGTRFILTIPTLKHG